MSAALLPNGKQQFIDINGSPLVAGTVGMYVPGTLIPKNTWQDTGETSLNTNPVILDSRGQALIYGTGAYRQIVRDAQANLIWDQLTYAPGTGGSQLFYLSDYTTLASADAACFAAHGLLVINTNYTLTADYTILCNHVYGGGEIITISHHLTVSGFFSSAPARIFNTSGGGSIVAARAGICAKVFFEWWGAVGDGSTDDLPAATAAWTFAASAGATVEPLSKTYFLNGTLSNSGVSNSASIVGQTPNRAFCSFKGNNSATILNLVQGSGFQNGNLIANIRFENAPLGIECNGMCGVNYDNLRFDTVAGILLHNKDVGQFTEDNVITQTQFTGAGIDLEYKITSGNTSFQGSGFGRGAQRNMDSPTVSKTCIQITSAGAEVYNAPLEFHVNNQTDSTTTIIVSNRASIAPDFIGEITAETAGTAAVTVIDTAHNAIYFDGPVHALTNTGLTYGLLIFARCFVRTAARGLLEDIFVPKQIALVPGSSTFALPELYLDSRRVCLQLFESAKYNQMYMIDVLKNDVSTGGISNVALHLSIDDTGVYGATTIAVAASGVISVTNANFPANSVSAIFTAKGYGLAAA